jgi:hypothetical protein
MPVHGVTAPVTGKWLLVSNCQTVGLTNCLSVLFPDADIEAYDTGGFLAVKDAVLSRLDAFDRIVVNLFAPPLADAFASVESVVPAPGFLFRGAHPDQCYVRAPSGELLRSPIGECHSAIAFAAFRLGLTATAARDLFQRQLYERLGFFALWEVERQALMQRFSQHGVDLRASFVDWMRRGEIAFGINHPHIHVLMAIARELAPKLTTEAPLDIDFLPPDNLAASAIFPVYPEIAERFGLVRRPLRFKPPGTYRFFSLEDFIEQSYDIYRGYDPAALTISDEMSVEDQVAAHLECR